MSSRSFGTLGTSSAAGSVRRLGPSVYISLLGSAMVAAVMLGGCVSTHYSKTGEAPDVAQFANVETSLDIGGPVEGAAAISEVLWFIRVGAPSDYADGVKYGSSVSAKDAAAPSLLGFSLSSLGGGDAALIETAESGACYRALATDKYDILLGARYIVHIDDYWIFKKIQATVRGTGARISGFRQTSSGRI